MNAEMVLSKIIGTGNNKLAYSGNANAFIGNCYTSNAGNHYFNAMRFAEGIVIKEDIGQGYKYAFLNGIKVYSLNDKTLITEESYHNVIYSAEKVKERIKAMLKSFLIEAARIHGVTCNSLEADRLINRLIDDAFKTDQRQMMDQQIKRLS